VARTSLKLLLAITLLALALPAAASARKNAWQLVSLSGTYAYHATNTGSTTCDPEQIQGAVLSRDYKASFRADSFPSYQYAAKYFPALEGPQTNGPGQKAHMKVNATSSETYRTFDSNCAPTDQTCSKAQSFSTARFMFGVTHKNFRPGGQLQTFWNISFNPTDCAPKDLQGALIPFNTNDIPSEFKARASRKSFTHKRATFTIHGGATVPKTSGFTATVTYSAKATLKKVVIPDGCVDLHRQHAFVCSN
jgi:opacity protein-like surface antigen